MDSYPRCGEIYLVRIPNKPADGKDRPALIVSLDIRNRLADDIIAVPLSTRLREAPTHVLIRKGTAGLRYDSMAKCEQITTLDKSLLIKGPFAGAVPEETMCKVYQAILNALGVRPD